MEANSVDIYQKNKMEKGKGNGILNIQNKQEFFLIYIV